MTPEEQAALEAEQAKAEAEAKDAEFETTIADLSDEEKEAKRAEREAQAHHDNQDYEAQLAREREARKKAEDALNLTRAKAAERMAERKRKEAEVGDDDPSKDQPLTASKLEEILARDREQNRKEVRNVQATEIAGKLATTEMEKNLIVEVWKNRTFPEHLTLDEQIEEAYAIANRKKLVGERNEALRALRGKGNINNNAAGAHHDAPKAGEPKLSSADQAGITGAGFVWNGVTRRHEKKLGRGLLIIDPQTKKTRLIKTS